MVNIIPDKLLGLWDTLAEINQAKNTAILIFDQHFFLFGTLLVYSFTGTFLMQNSVARLQFDSRSW